MKNYIVSRLIDLLDTPAPAEEAPKRTRAPKGVPLYVMGRLEGYIVNA